jgi:hypothetical protein
MYARMSWPDASRRSLAVNGKVSEAHPTCEAIEGPAPGTPDFSPGRKAPQSPPFGSVPTPARSTVRAP